MAQFLRTRGDKPSGHGAAGRRAALFAVAVFTWSLKALAGVAMVCVAGLSTQWMPSGLQNSPRPDATGDKSPQPTMIAAHLLPAQDGAVALMLHHTSGRSDVPLQRTLVSHYAKRSPETEAVSFLQCRPMSLSCDVRFGRVFLGCHDGRIYCLPSQAREQQWLLIGKHDGMVVLDLLCSPDGRLLASSNFKQVQIWDVANCQCLGHLPWQGQASGWLSFWRGSRELVLAELDGRLRRVDLVTGETTDLPSLPEPPQNVAISTQDPLLASMASAKVRVLNIDSGDLLWERPLMNSGLPIFSDFSPDGRLLALTPVQKTPQYSILVCDARTGQPVGRLRGHSKMIRGLKFCSNDRLYSWSNDGTVCVWDVSHNQPLHTWQPDIALATQRDFLN